MVFFTHSVNRCLLQLAGMMPECTGLPLEVYWIRSTGDPRRGSLETAIIVGRDSHSYLSRGACTDIGLGNQAPRLRTHLSITTRPHTTNKLNYLRSNHLDLKEKRGTPSLIVKPNLAGASCTIREPTALICITEKVRPSEILLPMFGRTKLTRSYRHTRWSFASPIATMSDTEVHREDEQLDMHEGDNDDEVGRATKAAARNISLQHASRSLTWPSPR